MKIVVLDGYALNPGDLDWVELRKLGDLTVYDRTPPEKVLERSQGADAIFTNKSQVPEPVISKLDSLKYIGVLATGYNIVDVSAARSKGIVVCNVPDYGSHSVAQHTFALLLELTNHVKAHADSARAGGWSSSKDWSYWVHPLKELAGKTMGIIGLGTIGTRVAMIASAFGMKVIATSRSRKGDTGIQGLRWTNVDELMRTADVISIHCPLTDETKGLINKESLSKMKRSAFLLNTSRGPIIVDRDLADALNDDIIAGAGIDVLSAEPPPAENPLLSAKNCIITPHVAWATFEARGRLMKMATENFEAFLKGRPQNVVS